jgi:uncharacterized protein YggE
MVEEWTEMQNSKCKIQNVSKPATLGKVCILNLAFCIATFLGTLPVYAQQQAPLNEPIVVTTGEGLVQAAPDRAWITISAESRASTAREAQKRNTDAMTPVLAKLKSSGVAADAIRTIAYDVQYEWDFVNGKRVGKGYVARNSVEVRVDNVERVGEYLEVAVASGATSLGGVRFDLKDRAKLEREALRLAVADARSKADAAAAGAGRAVERIVRIEEGGIEGGPVPVPRPFMRAEVAQVAAAPPIETGQTEIRARVTLTAVIK